MHRVNILAIQIVACAASALLFLAPVDAHSLKATYVPWGVDEFELFGLTEAELTKKFNGKLEFNRQFTKAFFAGYNRSGFGCPQFDLIFKDGKVVRVNRLFVDGAGCNILGPTFSSKKEALQFSIDGLSELNNRTPSEEAKLKTAKQLLGRIEGAKPAPAKVGK